MNPALQALQHHLAARARTARTLPELAFSIANDTYGLLSFRQALVFRDDAAGHELLAVSGLARPSEDSPYLIWLRRLWPWLRMRLPANGGWFEPAADNALPDELRGGWSEWWPTGVFALRLKRRDGQALGCAVFLLDAPPPQEIAQTLAALGEIWSYSWEMLAGPPRRGPLARWRALSRTRRRLILAALALFFLLPVRQSALAPAEVIALDAEVVAAPLDGVVKEIHVRPNQPVKAGEPLFSLDETTLKNRLAVAEKSVRVADAELLAATQKAFDNPQSKAELTQLAGRVQERRAELAATRAQLDRIVVAAARDGVAAFGDANDWLGKPVVTGERIMLLADPARPGVLIHLPVADAVSLEVGAPVRLFLTVRPLSPLAAHLVETSYQALPSPEGVASYRLRAAFDDGEDASAARIGLRGTAKVQGAWVVLGYYLLRRPLATLREWSGW